MADQVLTSQKGNIWDLRSALEDVNGEVFADSAHMTKLGNNAIAKEIVRRLLGRHSQLTVNSKASTYEACLTRKACQISQ